MDAMFVADYLAIESAKASACNCLSHGEGDYHAPTCPVRIMREAEALIRAAYPEQEAA